MTDERVAPVVRGPGSAVDGTVLSGTVLSGTAGGRGECWYVFSGSGDLDTDVSATVALRAGTAVRIKGSLRYQCRAC